MTQSQEPFLYDDDVVIPRKYICDVGGSVTVRDTAEGIEIESSLETRRLNPLLLGNTFPNGILFCPSSVPLKIARLM